MCIILFVPLVGSSVRLDGSEFLYRRHHHHAGIKAVFLINAAAVLFLVTAVA